MKSTFKYFFINVFIIINFYSIYAYAYRCGTDSLKIKPYKIEDDKVNKYSRRLSNYYTPIKIIVDYTQLTRQLNSKPNILSNLKERFNNVAKYFSSLLSVQHLKVELTLNLVKDNCLLQGNYNVASDIEDWLYNNDLIIFPSIDNTLSSQTLAAASACLVLDNYRPVGGFVALNSNLGTREQDSNVYFEMLLLHEFQLLAPGFLYSDSYL